MQDFSFDVLVGSIREIDAKFVSSAVKAVNVSLTLRNWCIGAYISEFELHGSNRAGYGDKLLVSISQELKRSGLKRCDRRELSRYILFYHRYPDVGSLLPEGVSEHYVSLCSPTDDRQNQYIWGIGETLSPTFRTPPEKLITSLSFSHLSEIMEIENPVKRLFYEIESIKGCWSVRELKRQVASMYFERSGLSKDKEALSRLANEGAEISFPLMAIRDPYVFEFLGLKPAEVMDESVFESALLDKLETFLLELGRGFCFEARQRRVLIGNEYYFVDLVFYHRILKCHILVELKTGRMSHEAVGQLNTYLNWFKENERCEGDNPPVGILLCTEKNDELVKYATAGIANDLFVSKYEVVLPSTDELEKFVADEIRVLRETDGEGRSDWHVSRKNEDEIREV
ncbi:PDDEXK nuclease domain-containing protein [Methanogenium cariaci]|jgi:predicted nuclease of restriction endonuclease-like (RecB) superfamily